jgi:GNAT superfamily N-acetyltransferase
VTDLRDLARRWQRGWSIARGLPATDDLGSGLRVRCGQMGRDVEYLALDGVSSIAGLAELVKREDEVTWLTVPTTEPGRAAEAIEGAGLTVLKSSERLMTVDLRSPPSSTPAPGYRLETRIEDAVVRVEVLDRDGATGASGTMGLSGADGIADKIDTRPGHRRRGLGRAVMAALSAPALARGAERGILIASEDGQHLYAALGWDTVADVLIASTPGVRYPD